MKQENDIKNAIVKSTNSIRKKYRDLHKQRLAQSEQFNQHYKPIIEPLNELIQCKEQLLKVETPKQSLIEIDNSNAKTPQNFKKLPHQKKLSFGGISANFEKRFDDSSIERANDQNSDDISSSPTLDPRIGREIVYLDDIKKDVKKKKSEKKQIKRKLRSKTGKGIQIDYMLVNKNNKSTELTYWNDPNELVDRLRLLLSSKNAGHSSHNNEIVSITEELREANIIF